MIVDGQIAGGPTEGFAEASMQWFIFDEGGNGVGTNFMGHLIPTAREAPACEAGATVGSPAAYVDAVIDLFAPLGVGNVDMPVHPDRVGAAIRDRRR